MNQISFIRTVIVLAGLLVLQPCHGAFNSYLTLTLNGEDVAGESTLQEIGGVDVSGSIECVAFNHEVFASGGGRKTHGPVKIVKRVDKSSPLLYQGFDQNQTATAAFKFFRLNSDSGETEHHYTITLVNARISSIRHWFPNTLDPAGAALPQMEEISFIYQSIIITSETGSTEYQMDANP